MRGEPHRGHPRASPHPRAGPHPEQTGQVSHTNRLDVTSSPRLRCNYIDVRTDLLTGWGEWRVGQITGAADWFELRWLFSSAACPIL